MEKFTVEEFRNFLLKHDSFGDALFYLSEVNIKIANIPDEEIFEDDDFENNFGINMFTETQ